MIARVSLAEFKAIRKKAAERARKRQEKGAALGLRHRKRNRPSSRKRAFARLKRLCKQFIMARANALNAGYCEIGMSCGGFGLANTWYHGWPQKGGNGLRYDVRSHFASCAACNMGEYGARMRQSPVYIERHRQILGEPLWNELNALHGRKPISTSEAVAIGDAIETKIKNKDWSR